MLQRTAKGHAKKPVSELDSELTKCNRNKKSFSKKTGESKVDLVFDDLWQLACLSKDVQRKTVQRPNPFDI